jgi:hypothetical protein
MYCGIVDLESGRITWYNSSLGASVFGMGGSANTDEAAGAARSIGALFKTYPASPGLNLVAVNVPAAPAPAPHVSLEPAPVETSAPVSATTEPATAP